MLTLPALPAILCLGASSFPASEEASVQILALGGIEVGELGKRSLRNFLQHKMPTYAAALAYQGLFALFPFIIFLGVLLVVLQMDSLFETLVEQAQASLPKDILAPEVIRMIWPGIGIPALPTSTPKNTNRYPYCCIRRGI